ncbi:MAG: carboxymuconolactone decarboxylase family protein [Sedimentisphaerales bacterium]|nr:carboxymuconolactone decarboxylase family protein [Sedimentisphaerales bacterium]
MAEDIRKFFVDFKHAAGNMNKLIPDGTKAFMNLFAATMKEGKLSVKQKELIALAVGLAIQCEPCIKLHVQKALAAGATQEEILEAAQVVLMMGGGPVFTHIPLVIETIDALQS